jgi:flavin reductase (DIM6/NTAB) family NADH-FMN oxidoreductase RutF
MPPAAIESLHVFYLCPRPVVLVSVCEGEQGNLFPMDLLGPFGNAHFALALRNTSPSVATMKRSGLIALADISARDCGTAYRLGKHHKTAAIDWNGLPFPVHRTARSSLPYPAIALRIRELSLVAHASLGSHTFFIAETVADQALSSEPRLFHTTSSFQRYRSSRGMPLQIAAPEGG